MKKFWKKQACFFAACCMVFTLVSFAAADTEAAGQEPKGSYASAYLKNGSTNVETTVDLTGGWSVEFASGAAYLYERTDGHGEECDGMLIMLDLEVYDEYMELAKASGTLREVEGGIAYVNEDGHVFYVFSPGEGAYFLLDVNAGLDGDAIYARISMEHPFTEGYGESELYTIKDMDDAAAKIIDEFSTWGCSLTDIRYAGDECSSEENLAWVNEKDEGKNYDQVIEFLMDFHSPADEAELGGTAWEPDTDYNDYQWWLARKEGGEWDLISWGY